MNTAAAPNLVKASSIPLPEIGAVDDMTRQSPPNATKWQRFANQGITRRLARVGLSLVVGVLLLLIINVVLVERKIKCASPEDCQKVRRLNTIVIGTRSIMNAVISLLVVFMILSQLGIDPRALLATAGVLGLVVGLGAQPFIKSFLAGMQVIIAGRFSIGDFVEVSLHSGKQARGLVTDFSLQNTTIQDLSGARYFVGNGDIALVTNYSLNDQRAQVEVTVSHVADISTVLDHLHVLATDMGGARVLLDKVVRPPVVKGITASSGDSYTITMAAFVTPRNELFVERYMRQRILTLLQSLNIQASAKTCLIRKLPSDMPPVPKPDTSAITAPPDTVRNSQTFDANDDI